jgi:hypothetical protein
MAGKGEAIAVRRRRILPQHPRAPPALGQRQCLPGVAGGQGTGGVQASDNRLECGKIIIGVCTGGRRRLACHRDYPLGFLVLSLKGDINHCPLSESGKSLAFCGKGAPGANPNSGLPPVLDRRATQASAR